jgi:hypothetical protein
MSQLPSGLTLNKVLRFIWYYGIVESLVIWYYGIVESLVIWYYRIVESLVIWYYGIVESLSHLVLWNC